MKKTPDWNDTYFKDRVDPSDENFRLVEIKLPHDIRAQPNYVPREYIGKFAAERLRRFCAVYLMGHGDITMKESEKILRKSYTTDTKES